MAGLGNPGPAYAPTRHNVGFWAVDDLASRLGARFGIARGQRAEVATGQLPGEHRLVLVKPTTYMNDSGDRGRGRRQVPQDPPRRRDRHP